MRIKVKNRESTGFWFYPEWTHFLVIKNILVNILKKSNILHNSGTDPEEWLIGLIKLIYKNKGDPMKTENYRPFTLLSCLGKVFTCILKKILETFADDIKLLKENQSGFRKNYSTLDHVF